ncbi:MAG: AlpA family phage regulatory protein [Methylocella sp.]
MYVNYHWLVDSGIMPNRVTLGRAIAQLDFPKPVELGRNRVAWNRDEVEAWRASRPRRTPKTGARRESKPLPAIVGEESVV